MTGLRWVQLSENERNEFLSNGGTGVLSFATGADEPPASLPVSYGYFADEGVFYFRLSFPPGSQKEDVIDNQASFVTYEQRDDGWRSVVATGTLEEVDGLPYESGVVQGMWAVEIPTVDVFDRPRDEITFHDFCLDPETLTGRKDVS
ncbi:pyridoxamine 5'-phosphate oxidase family protein [Halobacteria archaeon AArc-m2/3/4]|uniref:Pyridoxamine 5'-phosphate oxidase family protein n=1 Tax=Natronoglomus mannanivorans TaxID=2979990 RepID=A0AAP2Z3I4_9EURY|nr:pyridoxamine 5'-phosphate oxidase family protein [Halobacteria archaeon AArc-xg1-1]MCU4973919.1 pyridoxamine 5'-phosphate oxidase family protein [Halobacteria archaeon AArc-m2/3/4]